MNGLKYSIISSRATDSSDLCTISHCEIYGQARQGVAVTYGSDGKIIYNAISGTIDIEINAGSFEAKNWLVHGNHGRIQTEALTSPRISDLKISTSTLNTDPSKTSGNIISGNTCYKIQGQYNDGLVVTDNYVVGSETTETYLLDFNGVQNLTVGNNILIANAAVATSITSLLRTRGGIGINVTGNTGEDDGLSFHEFQNSFNSVNAANHYFRGNNFTGGGDYRAGSSTPFITEESVYKITTDGANPQVFTFTHVSGPLLSSLSASPSGANMVLNPGMTAGDGNWQPELFSYCETGAGAEPYDETLIYTVDISGADRIINVFSGTLAANPTYLQYNFANSGTVGTIFVRFKY